jgi:protein tyrosine phosphatase (PTP) superfamily phosphohydrolase (DUF442 family)
MLDMVEWVMEDLLARSSRPGFDGVDAYTSKDDVDRWLESLRRMGIKSILCLLAEEQISFCPELPMGLLSYYEDAGFQVAHIPAKDFQWPPLFAEQLEQVWQAYLRLPKPVLVHCNAGISRTGSAVEHIQGRLSIGDDMS